jgi:hypothetical protein
MLTQTAILRSYLVVKLAAVSLGLLYFVLPGVSLLLVAAFMMSVRVGSAAALHLATYLRTGIHVPGGWLSRSIVVAVLAGTAGGAAGLAVPGAVPDLVVVPLVCLTAYSALVRVGRILLPQDAALMLRVLPAARRGVELLAAPSQGRP